MEKEGQSLVTLFLHVTAGSTGDPHSPGPVCTDFSIQRKTDPSRDSDSPDCQGWDEGTQAEASGLGYGRHRDCRNPKEAPDQPGKSVRALWRRRHLIHEKG